jgi:two-component system response regulator RegA
MSEDVFTPRKLLVVDDDDLYRESLTRAFSRRHIETIGASTLDAALKVLPQLSPDSAIVDLRLGQESGLDVVRHLLDIQPTLKVVVLTAYGTITTALEAIKLGAVNYLTKPVDIDRIMAAFNGAAPSPKMLAAIPSADQVEWDYINRTVQDHDGNVTRAAQALGLHRRSLQRKLQKPPAVK